jgi:hypothetical protein
MAGDEVQMTLASAIADAAWPMQTFSRRPGAVVPSFAACLRPFAMC